MVLGMLYLNGLEGPQQIRKAFESLSLCKNAIAACVNGLGYIYYSAPDKKEPVDEKEKQEWMQKRELYEGIT